MTKKRSLIVALVAFAALIHPLPHLVSFADSLLCMLLVHTGCVNVPWGLQSKLVIAAYECFGPVWARPVVFLLPIVFTLIPVAFILKTAVGGEFFSRRGAERQRMLRKLQICSFIAVTRTICCFTL